MKKIFIILLSVLFQFTVMAQLQHITSRDGLIGESVYCFAHDSYGMVWIGTNNGVMCYNGHSFLPLTSQCERPLSLVHSLVEDAQKNMLVGMRDGLYRVNRAKATLVKAAQEPGSVSAMVRMDRNVYVASSNGLWCYQGGKEAKRVPFGTSVMSKGNDVTALCAQDSTHLWFTAGKTLYTYNTEKGDIKSIPLPDVAMSGHIQCMAYLTPYLYISTRGDGLCRFDVCNHAFSRCETITPNDIISLQALPTKGLLNIGTDGEGAYTYDIHHDSIVRHITYTGSSDGLPTPAVYSFFYDECHNVSWYGFFNEGFAHENHLQSHFEVYTSGTFTTRGISLRCFFAHQDEMVIGTRKGLYYIRHRGEEPQTFANSPVSQHIITHISRFANRYVICTWGGGLYTLDTVTGRVERVAQHELQAVNFTKSEPTPDGRLAALCDKGVAWLDSTFTVVQSFTKENSELPSTSPVDILFDHTGKGWIGTETKLCIYDPATQGIQSNGFPDGFFNDDGLLTFSLMPQGDVLAFSERKVYRSRPDLSHFSTIDLYDRLAPGIITLLQPDEDCFWMGTQRGLFLMDSTTFIPSAKTTRYIHLGIQDGLPEMRLNRNQYQKTPDGTRWFATLDGLVSLSEEHYRHLHDSIANSSIGIDILSVDGKVATAEMLLSMAVKRNIDVGWNFTSETVRLQPLLLDYATPEGRYYEYRVDVEDDADDAQGGFITISDHKLMELSHLSIGRHTLELRLAGHPETTTTYIISVWPNSKFYLTLFSFCSALLLCYIFIKRQRARKRRKLHYQQQHRQELEAMVEHTRETMLQEEQQRKEDDEKARLEKRYQTARINERDYREMQRALQHYMEEQRPYLNDELRITEVAKALGVHHSRVSQMLSIHLQTNFFDYVNQYRLQEFKRRVTDEKYNNYTLITIAEMCGFKKTSFYAAFRKIEGCTPAEYLQKRGVIRK